MKRKRLLDTRFTDARHKTGGRAITLENVALF
jgi:hypothetical protein